MEVDALVKEAIRQALLGDHEMVLRLLDNALYTEKVLLATCMIPSIDHNAEYFGLLLGLRRASVDINMKIGILGMPMLSHTICQGHYVTVRMIIGNPNINIEETDLQGFTPLHHATFYGDVDIVKCLLERGSNMYAKNNEGDSPSDLASKRGHTKVVQKLAKTDMRLRKLAFAMLEQKRLNKDAEGSKLSPDLVRKIALVAASDVGI
jgi:hypothetical protein